MSPFASIIDCATIQVCSVSSDTNRSQPLPVNDPLFPLCKERFKQLATLPTAGAESVFLMDGQSQSEKPTPSLK